MLTIRRPQLDIFRRHAEESFERSLVSYLAGEFPVQADTLGKDGLVALVRRSRADAEARGIHSAGAVGIWVELQIQFGEGLKLSPERAWAERILAHPSLPDYVKLEQVRERLNRQSAGRVLSSARA